MWGGLLASGDRKDGTTQKKLQCSGECKVNQYCVLQEGKVKGDTATITTDYCKNVLTLISGIITLNINTMIAILRKIDIN